MHDTTQLGEAAIAYARAGHHIFPIRPGTKQPLTRNGFHAATNDIAQVEAWWHKHPTANIGLRPPPNVVVIDVDPRNGGTDTFDRLCRELGRLPNCPTAHTASGGTHYWLTVPDGTVTTSSLGPGIDVKGHNGYVVVPPSVIAGSGGYRWERPL